MSELSEKNEEIWSKWDEDLRESRYKKVAKLILKEKPGRMLDVGCSSGIFSKPFIKKGWEVHGIDIAKNKVEMANKHGLIARTADLTKKLPYINDFFDMIFAGEVIEHLVDTDFFLTEMNRVLKKGGKIILTTPNLASFENKFRILFGVYPAWVDYRLGGAGHVRAYTFGVLRKQLFEHGFKTEVQQGNFVPFIPEYFLDDIKFPPLAWTGNLFPGLSQGIIIKAKKVKNELQQKS